MNCTKCNKIPVVFKRQYSGEKLCKSCFMLSVENKTLHSISKYSMIRYGERVAVGVSGGKDSLTLLYVLKKISKKHNNNELVAVTIDEGIEGYREESISIVKNFCQKINVPYQIYSYKDLFGSSMDEAISYRPSKKMSSCSICGTFRRRAIDLAAESVDADVVATAHNLDDHIHTFMINLLSGDVGRIGWMYPEPVEYLNGLRKIKPFVELYENEIVFYAFNADIDFQTDQCPYMNESIRSSFRLFFNELEKTHPGIKYNCYNSINKLSRIVKQVEGDQITKRSCLNCGEISTDAICSVCKIISILDRNSMKIDI